MNVKSIHFSPISDPEEPPKRAPKKSLIMSLPLPPGGENDALGETALDKKKKERKKPVVVGKFQPGPMTEDGRDWGERCVDLYSIVDKVGEGTYGEVRYYSNSCNYTFLRVTILI